MIRGFRRAAALSAAGAALVVAAGTGSAQAESAHPATAQAHAAPALSPGEVGTLRIGEAGLPSTVRIGQTVTMTVWFDQNSRYLLDVGGYDTAVWSPYYPSTDGKGMTVSYLSPVTNRWESSPAGAYGSFWFSPERAVYVKPNFWAHITVRITFTSHARLGAWYVSPGGFSYMMMKSVNGPAVPGTLNIPFGPWPGYKITVQG